MSGNDCKGPPSLLAADAVGYQRLTAVLDALPVYICLLARDYRVPFANRFFEERFGKSEGRFCYQYLFQRDAPCEHCESFRVFQTGAPHRWEWTGPDGRDYVIHDFPFTDSDGSQLVLETGIDVTEQKVIENRLRQSNRALRMVKDCAHALAHAGDEDDLLHRVCELAVDPGGYALAWIGYAVEDARRSVSIRAKTGAGSDYITDDMITWGDDERGCGPSGTCIRSGRPIHCADVLADPAFHPWRDRAVQFGFRSSLSVPLLHQGQAFGCLSIYAPEENAFGQEEIELFCQLADDLAFGIDALRNRTARAQAESALRNSEQRYRSLTVATAQVVWTTDPGGLVRGDMPMWRKFTGATLEQIQGWGWLDSLHPGDRDRTAAVWTAAVESRTLYETEYRLRRHDGEYRHVWVRGVPVLECDGSIREWVGTCTDITERHLAQQELERYAGDLKRSNDELQEFAFVASHDLQEPLRKVMAFSDRLCERAADGLDDVSRDYLARMQNAATRMSRLIESLLEYSRVTTRAATFEEVDLARLVLGVLSDMEQRIRESRAHLVISILPKVMGDATQLRQLLQNLLGNALKFHARGQAPKVELRAAKRGDRWEISCIDQGIGFDTAYTDKIFRPFQRLHGRSEFEGSGMGLAICRKIAQRHGAAITVHSEPGKGSAFTVSFPARAGNAGASPAGCPERTEPCPESRFESSSPRMMTTTTC